MTTLLIGTDGQLGCELRQVFSDDDLVPHCNNTRNVIPAVLKRESIEFAGYPVSRV